MRAFVHAADDLPRDRLAELVSAATYGCVLVLGALTVLGVSEVAVGQGAELVAGVGVATWAAHLFAELLGGHVHRPEPLDRNEVWRAAVDGSPMLVATVLPAFALLFGRLDVLTDATAKSLAILVTVTQLLAIGVFVARLTPTRSMARWAFVAVVVGSGVAVVALTVLLGH